MRKLAGILRKRHQTEMNEVHGLCEPWARRSARILSGFSGRRLNIRRRVGAIPQELQGGDTAYGSPYKGQMIR